MPARKSQKRARARRHFPAVYELAAFSVFGFCIAHGLPVSLIRSLSDLAATKCCATSSFYCR